MNRDRKQPGFWANAAYVAANDVTAVALYRVITAAMAAILLGMLGYFGNRIISGQDRMGTELATATANIVSMAGKVDHLQGVTEMANDRTYMDEARLAAVEARIDIVLTRRK